MLLSAAKLGKNFCFLKTGKSFSEYFGNFLREIFVITKFGSIFVRCNKKNMGKIPQNIIKKVNYYFTDVKWGGAKCRVCLYFCCKIINNQRNDKIQVGIERGDDDRNCGYL